LTAPELKQVLAVLPHLAAHLPQAQAQAQAL
jgi:hypothetical protein